MTITNMTVIYDNSDEWMAHSHSNEMKQYDYSTVLQMKSGKIKVTYTSLLDNESRKYRGTKVLH